TETFVVRLLDNLDANLPVNRVMGDIAPDADDTLVITVNSRNLSFFHDDPEGTESNPGSFVSCTGGVPTEPVRFTYTTERIGEANEDALYFRFFSPTGSSFTTDTITLSVAAFGLSPCAGGLALRSPDDNYNEGSQTVIIRFDESVAESAGPARVVLDIGSANTNPGEWTIIRQDNDPTTVRFIPDTPRTGFDESAAAVFNIAVSGGTLVETIPLQWSVSTDGIISGAVSANDFTDDAGNALTALPSGVAPLERGTSMGTVSITLPLNSNDAADEFREAFTFSLSIPSTAPGVYNLIPPPVRAAIAGRHRQRITAETTAAAEGATASITLTLDLDSADLADTRTSLPAGMAVTWLVLPGPEDSANPAEPADISTAARTGQITFASGAADGATAAISLPIVNDNLNEGTETWTVVLDGDDGATDTPEAITADIALDPADAIVVEFPTVDVDTFPVGITESPIAEGIRFFSDTRDRPINFTGGLATEDIRFAYTQRRQGEALTGQNYFGAFVADISGDFRTVNFGASACPAGAAESGDTLCFSLTPFYINGGSRSPAFDFAIPVPDDNLNEGRQTIDFRFREAVAESAGLIEVRGGPVRLMFNDDDTSTITLSASTTATAEGGVVRITAEVSGGIPGQDLPLDYVFETTLSADDFNDASGAPLTALDNTLTVAAM
ncbi:MAG: hypothetical protein OXU61_04750, partial [Gammaproteobacteria bacterium]|nr:hypothetical protein [Gammaproteobacteria bacterium]